jgi:hypothetical protein
MAYINVWKQRRWCESCEAWNRSISQIEEQKRSQLTRQAASNADDIDREAKGRPVGVREVCLWRGRKQ